MIEHISFQAGVTLAGGGPFNADDLQASLAVAPHPVAADGGANRLMALGTKPEAIIGDMDSLCGPVPDEVRVIAVAEQDSTDFGKCLAHVEAPFYVGVGFLGGRLDHTLAVLSCLLGHPEKPVLLIGEEDVAFLAPPYWQATLAVGARVSFFPMLPCRGVSSEGLRWPLAGLEMSAGGVIGTSNEAVDARVAAHFDRAGMITILPKCWLGAAMASLGCDDGNG